MISQCLLRTLRCLAGKTLGLTLSLSELAWLALRSMTGNKIIEQEAKCLRRLSFVNIMRLVLGTLGNGGWGGGVSDFWDLSYGNREFLGLKSYGLTEVPEPKFTQL